MNKIKKWYNGVEYDSIIYSGKQESPRGYDCHYSLINNGVIVTIGTEHGNYSGGIDAENQYDIEHCIVFMETTDDKLWKSLYENLKAEGLIQGNKIKITKIVDWDIALDDALFTINKEGKHKIPSDKWIAKACLAEHSMIRDVRYILEMKEIPCWVSQHIARHDAFSHHTVRESEETHFVGTSRTDRTGVDRNKLPQDTPVNHRISLSAQDFITISQRRLCTCASKETRELWKAVIEELRKIDPVLADKCVPMCIYRGFCPEFESCGYAKTEAFLEKLKDYRDIEKYEFKKFKTMNDIVDGATVVKMTPEEMEKFEKNQYKNDWKDLGNIALETNKTKEKR